ncbi:unnamed protein product [Microthlaspi erraticum]|uniref:FBD domain-containing protein n=1 Tax=Microthlaspi erraticum TaxID=1685480 RepID=A0A6D2JCJ2_9BRAS|nr:unnamed protein product [Microthlaspi erraticum]
MAGRGKSKRCRSKKSRQRLKELDRISELPDPLICQILSHLAWAKEVVKTSVLSSRWRSLWLEVPNFKLSSVVFPDFRVLKSIGDTFFDSNRISCIQKLKLHIFEDDDEEYRVGAESYPTSWIDAAAKRKLQRLYVFMLPDYQSEIPISLYTCKTLVSLKLYGMVLPGAGFVSLPCLKLMKLRNVRCPDEATFERLVSCSPVLQVLKIAGHEDFHRAFPVHSLSLKKLQAKLERGHVVIDAPLLGVLKIEDTSVENYVIRNLASSFKLDLTLLCGKLVYESAKRNSFRVFLSGISNVGEMVMSEKTFKVFHLYSIFEPMPQFLYLSRLDATICPTDLKWLPAFLGCCPNLKSLVMGLFYTDELRFLFEQANQFSFSSVPECSLSSLESVDIDGICGNAADVKLVRYILENSIILKKLTLDLRYCHNENAILKKLLGIPRRSITCQVLLRESEC